MTYLEQIAQNLEIVKNYETTGFVITFEYFLTLSYKGGATQISSTYEPQTFTKMQADVLVTRVKNGKGETPVIQLFADWKRDCINDLEEMLSC